MTASACRITWAPEWASAWGEDEYGLFAEFQYKGVVQRMRWIGPGRFWMGSPKDEVQRAEKELLNELLHEVEVAQGFWLADTTCTQELWLAVMGGNPSHFSRRSAGENSSPVEMVSWNMVQEFNRRLSDEVPGLNIRLPTEAEWEYSCRAGTATPFSFGSVITPSTANYNAHYPRAGRAKSVYRGKTIPVKSLPANPWGLYEMHGNVWEWCLDAYAPYEPGLAVDPCRPPGWGRYRVVRGGSWSRSDWHARSASRFMREAGRRFGDLGFRFVHGRPIGNRTRSVPVNQVTPARLKVLYLSAEVTPYCKAGGLAEVAGVLPRFLRRREIDIRVVMPFYRETDPGMFGAPPTTLSVPTHLGPVDAQVHTGSLPGSDVPAYAIEYGPFFDRPYLYGPPGQAYADNLERFAFLSRAAVELCKSIGFVPDVIHANDWQTALVPVYVNTLESTGPLRDVSTLFTIHNLAYQGSFDSGAMHVTGLGYEHYNASEFEHQGSLNLVKAAFRYSTLLSTVSPTYAREIQTREQGFGLDEVLSARSRDMRGVLNGIDMSVWDPGSDPHIPAKFSSDDLTGKLKCKSDLQIKLDLAHQPDTPLLCLIGRLSPQKGVDVFAQALHRILSLNVQVAVLGLTEHEGEHFFSYLHATHRDRFSLLTGFDEDLVHRLIAGSDFLLAPSRFEPSGLNQMYSQRYGTLPIVRGTGGLRDTVVDYDRASGAGTGFIFSDLTPDVIVETIRLALSTYTERPEHIAAMRKRAMEQDFSWEHAASEYEKLYLEAYRIRRGHGFGTG